MRVRSRVLSVLPGTVCALGAAIMFVGTFLPYLGWYGDALPAADDYPNQVYSTLITGADAVFIIGTIVILAAVAVCHLAGFHRRMIGVIGLVGSLVAVDRAVKLPGTYPGSNYGMPNLMDAGVAVFRDGALTCLGGALVMAVTGLAGVRPKSAVPMAPSPLVP